MVKGTGPTRKSIRFRKVDVNNPSAGGILYIPKAQSQSPIDRVRPETTLRPSIFRRYDCNTTFWRFGVHTHRGMRGVDRSIALVSCVWVGEETRLLFIRTNVFILGNRRSSGSFALEYWAKQTIPNAFTLLATGACLPMPRTNVELFSKLIRLAMGFTTPFGNKRFAPIRNQ